MASPLRLDQIRMIAWRKSFLWEIFFPGENLNSFKGWVPAVSVVENTWNLQSYDFTAGISSYKIPMKSSVLTVQVSFHDDEKLSIERWLQAWVNTKILLSGGLTVNYVSGPDGASKHMMIRKLNTKREVLYQSDYKVFPEGASFYEGDSESSSPIISVIFIVTKIIRQNEPLGESGVTTPRVPIAALSRSGGGVSPEAAPLS